MMPEHIMNLVGACGWLCYPKYGLHNKATIQSMIFIGRRLSWILSGLRLMAVKCI